MTDDQFRNLVNLYIDNEITEDDLARLKAEVEYDSRRRALFRRYCHMNEVSRRVMDDGHSNSKHSRSSEPKRKKSRSKYSSRSKNKHKSSSQPAVSSQAQHKSSRHPQSRRSSKQHAGEQGRSSTHRNRAQEELTRTGSRDTYLKGLQSLAKWGALAACLAFVVGYAFKITERHHADESAALEAELAKRQANAIHPAYMFAGVQVEESSQGTSRPSAQKTPLPENIDSLESLTAYPLGITDGGVWPTASDKLAAGQQPSNSTLAGFAAPSSTPGIIELARSLKANSASSMAIPVSMDIELVPAQPKPKILPAEDYEKQIIDAKSKMDQLEAEAMKAFEDGEF